MQRLYNSGLVFWLTTRVVLVGFFTLFPTTVTLLQLVLEVYVLINEKVLRRRARIESTFAVTRKVYT